MTIEVRYFSRSGNTKAIAEAIAKALGTEAKDVNTPLAGEMELLFLGGALYAGGIAGKLKKFIKEIDPGKVRRVVAFSTTADPKGAYVKIKKTLDRYGIPVAEEEFHCLGKDAGESGEQNRAAEFARRIAAEYCAE